MDEALTVELRADIKSFATAMNEANQSLLKLVEGTKKTSQATSQMANTMKVALAGLAAGLTGKLLGAVGQLQGEFIKLAEAPSNFRSSIKALTGDTARAEDMLKRVYEVAKRTGTGFDDTADIVKRLTVGMKDLGANNSQIAQMAENLFKLGRIGGASVADTAGAALQLSQALASGKLQGDELRSIMERMPMLGQAIAKEMGVSVGELKKLGAEGKITADVIANSLLKSTKEIGDKFKEMPLTVGQAMNNVRTSIQQAFDNPAVAAAIQGIARAVNGLATYISTASRNIAKFATDMTSLWNTSSQFRAAVIAMASALSVALIPALQAAGVAVVAFSRAILAAAMSNPWTALATVAVGAAVLIITNWERVGLFFTTAFPGYLSQLAGVMSGVMGQLVKIAYDAWEKIKQLFAAGVNFCIQQINAMIGALNSVAGAMSSWTGVAGNIVEPIKEITVETGKGAAALQQWQATAQSWANTGTAYMNQYKAGLAELDAKQKDATTSANDLAQALNNAGSAAGDGGGGKGGKGGGAAKGIKKAGDAAKKAAQDMKDAKSQVEEFGQAMQGIAQSLGSGVVDALFSIADGSKSAKEAFTELAKSMLKQIANMIMQLLILKPLMGMFGGGFGGLMGGGGGGLMGMSRSGPSLMGASRSGTIGNYSGFNMSPAAMTSIRSSAVSVGSAQHAAPMNVTINNNSSAAVKTRKEADALYIDIIEEVVSDRITRGGNKIDASLSRAFGVRRIGY